VPNCEVLSCFSFYLIWNLHWVGNSKLPLDEQVKFLCENSFVILTNIYLLTGISKWPILKDGIAKMTIFTFLKISQMMEWKITNLTNINLGNNEIITNDGISKITNLTNIYLANNEMKWIWSRNTKNIKYQRRWMLFEKMETIGNNMIFEKMVKNGKKIIYNK
jgi:uncharacterized protein YifE (UPF0438 family)